ncbi:hypothetical protein H6G36_04060 [Anabaena minutissima FACHB-250]|nr:hypothetical protein [Anabaena minutissima FACHB-250]
MEALFQELVQEKFANILQSQIKEQAAVVELLNNNLATLIAVQITLEEKHTENNPVLNKNIQSYSPSFSENFDQDLENKELSSGDILLERVKKVISEQSLVKIENINLDHSLVLGQCFGSFLSSSNNHAISSNDFNMDELDTVELLMAIEEEFEIEISDAEAEIIRTVKELVNIVSFKLNQKQLL